MKIEHKLEEGKKMKKRTPSFACARAGKRYWEKRGQTGMRARNRDVGYS